MSTSDKIGHFEVISHLGASVLLYSGSPAAPALRVGTPGTASCTLGRTQNVEKHYMTSLLLTVSFSVAVFCTGRTHMMSVCAAKLSNTSYGVVGEHQRVLHRIIYGSRGSLPGHILCDDVRAVIDASSGVSV